MVNPPHLDDVYISIECNIFYKFCFFYLHMFSHLFQKEWEEAIWIGITLYQKSCTCIQKCICLYTLYWVILPPGFFGMLQCKKFKQIRMLVMSKIVNQKKMHCLCLTLLLPCSLIENFSEYVDVYIIQLRYIYILSIEHFKKIS